MGGNKKETGGHSGHKALYRKHRSRSFDEVKGQDHITRTLTNAIKGGQISHAYLFTGPRGVGKTSIARILAHEVNRLPYQDESTHLDIIEIDAASNRRIDDIRDLREKVHIAPVSAKYKVYIIDEVHMLTPESFNALLKTLEEPPAHVIFILATTEAHKLPATIISRTQRHHFRSIPTEEITDHLKDLVEKENISITDEALELLARYSGGSFRDSISLLDQLGSIGEEIDQNLVALMLGIAPEDRVTSLISDTKTGDPKAIIESVEEITNEGISPLTLAHQCIDILRRQLSQNDIISAKDITLIDKLTEVEHASNPKLKLETILLSFALEGKQDEHNKPNESQPNIEKRAKSAQVPEEKKASKANENPVTPPASDLKKSQETRAKASEAELEIEPTGEITVSIDEWWPGLLDAIKKKNNPLYTILRLAKPKLNSETELELAFGFEFHRKRIDDSKYRTIISSACLEVVGAAPNISTVLEKDLASTQVESFSMPASQPAELDSAQASQIAAIQDIMGGGEIMQHA